MIELIWKYKPLVSETENTLYLVASLLRWITSKLDEIQLFSIDDAPCEVKLRGFFVVEQDDKSISILLVSENKKYQTEIMKILQQPPGEFKERYIARILCDEPIAVSEKKEEIKKSDYDDDESDSGVEIEIEDEEEKT